MKNSRARTGKYKMEEEQFIFYFWRINFYTKPFVVAIHLLGDGINIFLIFLFIIQFSNRIKIIFWYGVRKANKISSLERASIVLQKSFGGVIFQ